MSKKRQERQVETADEALSLAAEGRVEAARRTIAAGLPAGLPELPLRFTVSLVHLADTQIKDLVDVRQAIGESPSLLLSRLSDGKGYGVRWFGGQLGRLSRQDIQTLNEFGAAVGWFSVRLTELHVAEDGRADHLEVELVRPELRVCSSCGRLHAGSEVNCDECRHLRRRKGEETTTYERPPVPLQRAIEALTLVTDYQAGEALGGERPPGALAS